jgi:hypothetical protein
VKDSPSLIKVVLSSVAGFAFLGVSAYFISKGPILERRVDNLTKNWNDEIKPSKFNFFELKNGQRNVSSFIPIRSYEEIISPQFEDVCLKHWSNYSKTSNPQLLFNEPEEQPSAKKEQSSELTEHEIKEPSREEKQSNSELASIKFEAQPSSQEQSYALVPIKIPEGSEDYSLNPPNKPEVQTQLVLLEPKNDLEEKIHSLEEKIYSKNEKIRGGKEKIRYLEEKIRSFEQSLRQVSQTKSSISIFEYIKDAPFIISASLVNYRLFYPSAHLAIAIINAAVGNNRNFFANLNTGLNYYKDNPSNVIGAAALYATTSFITSESDLVEKFGFTATLLLKLTSIQKRLFFAAAVISNYPRFGS